MYGANILKDYYIVYFNFSINKFFVYKYIRNRKLTANQRWRLIENNEFEPEEIAVGIADNVGQFDAIMKNLNLPEKRCSMNMTFNLGGK